MPLLLAPYKPGTTDPMPDAEFKATYYKSTATGKIHGEYILATKPPSEYQQDDLYPIYHLHIHHEIILLRMSIDQKITAIGLHDSANQYMKDKFGIPLETAICSVGWMRGIYIISLINFFDRHSIKPTSPHMEQSIRNIRQLLRLMYASELGGSHPNLPKPAPGHYSPYAALLSLRNTLRHFPNLSIDSFGAHQLWARYWSRPEGGGDEFYSEEIKADIRAKAKIEWEQFFIPAIRLMLFAEELNLTAFHAEGRIHPLRHIFGCLNPRLFRFLIGTLRSELVNLGFKYSPELDQWETMVNLAHHEYMVFTRSGPYETNSRMDRKTRDSFNSPNTDLMIKALHSDLAPGLSLSEKTRLLKLVLHAQDNHPADPCKFVEMVNDILERYQIRIKTRDGVRGKLGMKKGQIYLIDGKKRTSRLFDNARIDDIFDISNEPKYTRNKSFASPSHE